MPTMPDVPNVARTIISYVAGSGKIAQNTLHWHATGGWPVGDIVSLAGNVGRGWAAHVMPNIGTDWTLTGVQATDLTTTSGAQVFVSQSAAGSKPTAPVPLQCAIVVSQRIARRYRGGHPRIYLPGIVASELPSPQLLDAAFVAALELALEAFKIEVEFPSGTDTPYTATGTVALCNVSYFSGFTNVTSSSGRAHARPSVRTAPVVDTVLALSVHGKIGTQRRRAA